MDSHLSRTAVGGFPPAPPKAEDKNIRGMIKEFYFFLFRRIISIASEIMVAENPAIKKTGSAYPFDIMNHSEAPMPAMITIPAMAIPL